MSAYYLTAGDGTCVAWGPEPNPPDHDRGWGVSVWTADPRVNLDARPIDRLVCDVSYGDAYSAVSGYLREHGEPPVVQEGP